MNRRDIGVQAASLAASCATILSQLSLIRKCCLQANAALGGGNSIMLEMQLRAIEARVQAIREEMKR